MQELVLLGIRYSCHCRLCRGGRLLHVERLDSAFDSHKRHVALRSGVSFDRAVKHTFDLRPLESQTRFHSLDNAHQDGHVERQVLGHLAHLQ